MALSIIVQLYISIVVVILITGIRHCNWEMSQNYETTWSHLQLLWGL